METFLIRAIQLILSLSILVFLHEFGHFFFARLFKVRVEKFYMFFNPNFSIVRAKKINGKWQVRFFARNVPANERQRKDADGDLMIDGKGRPLMEPIPLNELSTDDWRAHPDSTEWGIGWLPLGGYCKIAGMIDESMDKTQMSLPPQKWEYRSRPVWQRLPIIIGGVLVNFILAMVIYAAVLFTWGQEYLPFENARYGFQFSEVFLNNGFRNGDKIISIEGEAVEQRADFVEKLLIDRKREVLVQRDSTMFRIRVPEKFWEKMLKATDSDFITPRYPFVIDDVVAGSPAEKAALMAGDSVVSVNGKPMTVFQDIADELNASADREIAVGVVRNGTEQTLMLKLNEDAKMGVNLKSPFEYFETSRTEYGFFEAIPAGIGLGWETLVKYVKQFKLVFTKEGSKQLGGFGSIGKMFPKVWDWQIFWSMTALLSVILAFMNFLPIPALDGGHVMFLLYEMITGRKPGEKFMEYSQTAGMILLLALLVFANGNDIIRAFFK